MKRVSALFAFLVMAAVMLPAGPNSMNPPRAYAHALESCVDSTHDSSKIKVKALIDHSWGKGFVRAEPSWTTCGDDLWVATNVSDVYLESHVQELQSGNWVECAYTYPGWRGSAPGSGEWYETWNYYYQQSCTTGYTHRTWALGKGLFQDGHEIWVWAFSSGHDS